MVRLADSPDMSLHVDVYVDVKQQYNINEHAALPIS